MQEAKISAQEAVDMMKRCKAEIESLRAHIAHIEPKAAAYDNIATILRLLPKQGIGMGEDVVWTLDKRIRELQPPVAKASA
jgi:hypothetical protein